MKFQYAVCILAMMGTCVDLAPAAETRVPAINLSDYDIFPRGAAPTQAQARFLVETYAAVQKSCGRAIEQELGSERVRLARYGVGKHSVDSAFEDCILARVADYREFDDVELVIPETWK